jgi:hypothetical protein
VLRWRVVPSSSSSSSRPFDYIDEGEGPLLVPPARLPLTFTETPDYSDRLKHLLLRETVAAVHAATGTVRGNLGSSVSGSSNSSSDNSAVAAAAAAASVAAQGVNADNAELAAEGNAYT